jgi:hypothetical protein
LVVLFQKLTVSAQDFCHCSASCIQTCSGFIAAFWKASVFGQLAAAVKFGKDFSLTNITDGEAVIGFGNLICSSQVAQHLNVDEATIAKWPTNRPVIMPKA